MYQIYAQNTVNITRPLFAGADLLPVSEAEQRVASLLQGDKLRESGGFRACSACSPHIFLALRRLFPAEGTGGLLYSASRVWLTTGSQCQVAGPATVGSRGRGPSRSGALADVHERRVATGQRCGLAAHGAGHHHLRAEALPGRGGVQRTGPDPAQRRVAPSTSRRLRPVLIRRVSRKTCGCASKPVFDAQPWKGANSELRD